MSSILVLMGGESDKCDWGIAMAEKVDLVQSRWLSSEGSERYAMVNRQRGYADWRRRSRGPSISLRDDLPVEDVTGFFVLRIYLEQDPVVCSLSWLTSKIGIPARMQKNPLSSHQKALPWGCKLLRDGLH